MLISDPVPDRMPTCNFEEGFWTPIPTPMFVLEICAKPNSESSCPFGGAMAKTVKPIIAIINTDNNR